MITLNKVINKAFGLSVTSEIPLPELSVISAASENIDICVEISDLKDLWKANEKPNQYFIVKEEMVLFLIPNTAIYCVKGGNSIIVSPLEGSNVEHIRLYILGTCMGVILMQRRIIPLHGSAIAINGKAYAIVGDAGAGKSTLASAFLQRGYNLLSDDVIPVSFSENNIPFVTPAYPHQKLWQESLTAFGIESNNYQPIFDRETKFSIPVTEHFSTEVLPLGGIFELIKSDADEPFVTPITNLQRLHTLFYHTYRNFLIEPLGLLTWHFRLTVEMANQLQIYQLQRPIGRFTAIELTELILNSIHKENKE